jgi:glutaminyl-peptide cyclotransferase
MGSDRRSAPGLALLLGAALSLGLASGCQRGVARPPFDEARAFRDLEAQTAFGPRVPGSEAHRRCREFLARELAAAGGRVTVQAAADTAFPIAGVDTLYNLRARFGPETGPYLVLGAHWDSRPRADRDPVAARRAEPVLGANDGASGVAVLLEVARTLGRRAPAVGVEIVLFDGEDAGSEGDPGGWVRGSQAYVAALAPPLPLHAVVVDMVGRRGLRLYQEANSRDAAGNLVDRLWAGARKVDAPAFLPEVRYNVVDDHIPFIRAGIPGVDLIDLDDPNWHTAQDTPAGCDPGSLGQVGRVLLWHVYTLETESP